MAMTARGVFVLTASLSLAVSAVGFGMSAEIKATHPELFNSEHVSVTTNGGVAHYVYSGRVRRLFRNRPMAAFPQLRDMAQLRAESNLSRFLQKGMSKRVMTLKGSHQVAKDVDGDWVTYVFAVPANNVTIQSPPLPVPPVQTNRVVVSGNPSESDAQSNTNDTSCTSGELLSFLDQVEQDPENGIFLARLAKAYFNQALYDDSIEAAIKAQEIFLSEINANMPEDKVKAFLVAAAVLKDCGESRKARECYRAVQRLNRAEHRSEVLRALSQIQLELGIE